MHQPTVEDAHALSFERRKEEPKVNKLKQQSESKILVGLHKISKH